MALPFSTPGGGAPTMPMAAPGALRPPSPAGPGGAMLPPPSFGGFPSIGGGGAPDGTTYEAVTQSDGTVLLHLKLPDGTLGPAVKIVSVPSPKGGGMAFPGVPSGLPGMTPR